MVFCNVSKLKKEVFLWTVVVLKILELSYQRQVCQFLADCPGQHLIANGVARLEGSADCLLAGVELFHVRRRAGLLLFPELNIDLEVIKREAEEPVGDMGIALGGLDRGMSEKGLNDPDVVTTF